MEQNITTPVVKGAIITLGLIIFSLIIYFADLWQNQSVGYIQHVIFIGGVIWSCILYSKQMNSNVNFGNVFAHGFKTSAVVICLMTIYTIISLKFLFPDMVDKSLDVARKKMEESGKLSDEDIDKQIGWIRDHFMMLTVAVTVFVFVVVGLIASVIGAAFAKKNPPNPFVQQPM
jgi:hypothetical protein